MKITSTITIDKPLQSVYEQVCASHFGYLNESCAFQEEHTSPASGARFCDLLSKDVLDDPLRKRLVKTWETGKAFCKESLCFMNLGEQTRIICTLEVYYNNWLQSYFDFFYLDKFHREHDGLVNKLKSRLS